MFIEAANSSLCYRIIKSTQGLVIAYDIARYLTEEVVGATMSFGLVGRNGNEPLV